ncbi:MAG: DUF349 domain-containing protein [Actinomycetaceae bacterium]|nr:DUF349 domain-containing protein [Actinomycetaceae bacterium]
MTTPDNLQPLQSQSTTPGTDANATPSGAEHTGEDETAKVAQAPSSTPKPAPRPHPHPVPKPRVSRPQQAPLQDDAAAAEAAQWGRVDDDGNVWLRAQGEDPERIVGQYAAGGSASDALGLYVRRFLDLKAQVALLESRIESVSPEESRKSVKSLREQLDEPAAVGDIQSLRDQLTRAEEKIAARAEVVAAQRAEAKEASLAQRTAIVEQAEEIAAQDPARTHWRDSRAKLTDLLEQWKHAQRHSARIDRPTEEALWKRFSSARTQFDRRRRQHFSELESMRQATIARKEELIAQAEAIQNSTDWGSTTAQYRQLLEEWKRAGRSVKKEDDKLWERFRAAQQVFFDARQSHNAQIDEEYSANLERKLALVAEAETILPITDLEAAKEKLRAIGDEWDQIGRVPRGDVQRTEGRLREIERKVRDAENERWEKSDPEKEERSNGMAAQLEQLIVELEAQIEQAKAAGEDKKVKEYEEALAARKSWLAAVLGD